LLAQQPVVTEDEVKVSTYKRFVENRVPNPAAAYEAAKDYMARYGKENDQYTRYLKTWIAAWEEDERLRKAAEARDDRQDKLQAINQKKFTDAGQAKQVLADDPNNVKVQFRSLRAFIASTESATKLFNADAAGYDEAVQLIESGKSPDTWSSVQSKETCWALWSTLGFYA
jgi:hypothetical protein